MTLNPVTLELLAADIAARRASGEHFMLVMLPGDTTPRFVTPDMHPWCDARMCEAGESTPRDRYIRGVAEVVRHHRAAGGGKTVISRVKVTAAPALDNRWWCSMLGNLAGSGDNTLRYVAGTGHGLWIGATPEILVCVDRRAGRFDTMALAGTRQLSDGGLPWDKKNSYENALVGRYIVGRLESLGLEPHAAEPETLQCGPIEHIIQRISGDTCGREPYELAAVLNPTPALAGYPMAEARRLIAEIEEHDRAYYGGVIVCDDGNLYRAWVNLRCCRISDGRLTAYGGGGITADSDPESEWDESERKMSVILGIAGVS